MKETKKVDKRESLRVVTANTMIDAQDLYSLSLNARKLLYLAISQCRKNDSVFYEYEITPLELSEMWGISRQEVYQVVDKITTELMKIVIKLKTGEKSFRKRHLFEKCVYDDDKVLCFKLHAEMTDLLLGLEKDFSKPLVWDFMKMRSPYSMAIWHLMQREMKSFKPMTTRPISFDMTLEELRGVTGTESKLKQIGQFKERVLDKALQEIQRNCFVKITYTNIKRGRRITGFWFTAESVFGTFDMNEMPYRMQKHIRKAQLINKKSEGNITKQEEQELETLKKDLEQMTLEDVEGGYLDKENDFDQFISNH